MPLTPEQMQLRRSLYEVFPNIYFTIMSVIQGVAMGVLATKIVESLILSPPTDVNKLIMTSIYAGFSFFGIIVIACEYSYYVAIIKRPPYPTDIAVPIVLGMTQIGPLFFLTEPGLWWLLTGVFAGSGCLAYLNSLWKVSAEMKKGKVQLHHKAISVRSFKKCTILHFAVTFFIALICYTGAYLHFKAINNYLLDYLLLIAVATSMLAILGISNNYLKSLYEKLEMH